MECVGSELHRIVPRLKGAVVRSALEVGQSWVGGVRKKRKKFGLVNWPSRNVLLRVVRFAQESHRMVDVARNEARRRVDNSILAFFRSQAANFSNHIL